LAELALEWHEWPLKEQPRLATEAPFWPLAPACHADFVMHLDGWIDKASDDFHVSFRKDVTVSLSRQELRTFMPSASTAAGLP
jgi:hypothetical protein